MEIATSASPLPLHARLEALLPTMAGAESRVALVLLEDPGRASRMTIADLASTAGCSESTVVRTARTLGFAGYPELRLALAGAAAVHGADPAGPDLIAGDVSSDDSLDVVVAKLCAMESRALSATAATLTSDILGPVVRSLASARAIDIYGVGISGLVAEDLGYKLLRLGVRSQVLTSFHHSMASAPLLRAGDVVLAISHSGRTPDVLEPFRAARSAGATAVAVTSQPRSPLARSADHVLVSASHDEPLRPGAMAGRTSQLLVCDAIFVGVAQQDQRSLGALTRTRVDPAKAARRAARRDEGDEG